MKNKGFTLIETLVTVGVIGVLSAIATYGYHLRIVKTQTSEAILAMEGAKSEIMVNLTKYGKCTATGGSVSTKHKYGELAVLGTANADAIKHPNTLLSTGCKLKYTFSSTSVSILLSGKILEAELFNNSVLKGYKVQGSNVVINNLSGGKALGR